MATGVGKGEDWSGDWGGGMPGGGKEIIQENIADSILKHL